MLDDRQLSQIFLRKELINDETLKQAQGICQETGKSLYHVLIENKLVEEERAIVAVSKQLNLPCVSLREFEPNPKILELVPVSLANAYQLMPLGLTEEDGERKLYVAMGNPLDLEAIEEVSKQSGFPVVPLLAGPLDVSEAVAEAYGQTPLVEVEIEEEIGVEGEMAEGLGEMLDGIFEEEIFEEIITPEPPQASTPAKPSRPVTVKGGAKTKPGFSLGIDFSNLDLSLPKPGNAVEDLHTKSTLPAGTKLPDIVKPVSPASSPPVEAPTPVPPTPAVEAAAEDEEEGGMFGGFGDWGDLEEIVAEEPSTESGVLSRHPAPNAGESSNIRYVADANLRRRSSANDVFPNNIPVSDLIRATVRLLIKKRVMTENEIKEEIRLMRGQGQRRPNRR